MRLLTDVISLDIKVGFQLCCKLHRRRLAFIVVTTSLNFPIEVTWFYNLQHRFGYLINQLLGYQGA